MTRPHPIAFTGFEGNRLVGDLYEAAAKDAPVALFLHGGGQTRHAWRGTERRVAEEGFTAIAYDHRGHGDSEWPASGLYGFPDCARDLIEVTHQIEARFGRRPIAIGASLGGISGMLAAGETDPCVLSALVLVDVAPRVNLDGVARILGFMGERVAEGFGSIEEAAAAVAAYLPHRKPPRSLEGLKKNLRLHADGRWRWHWDPRFLTGPSHDPAFTARLEAAVTKAPIPMLLVRGARSELLQEEHARAFRDLVPSAAYADVTGAGHMVAGDRNDAFADAVIGFLRTLKTG
ncbi:peroxidase [Prosthecomicrobium hirschii]|uniref:Peroxidase n=1 Tax=Prosthecodimorpha hirschii TaxID=665126 RepID=A0A0P6WAN9_9HYPH|nr:alpha/beta hydrolase [Prosthecomicrobium hirschii]KPL51608.1 peroxidase [Prosthecomicrobium hirschii]